MSKPTDTTEPKVAPTPEAAPQQAVGVDALVMRHRHDCDKCEKLGQFDEYDLYYCNRHGMPTLIARYGEEDKYRSGMVLGKSGIVPVLSIAYHMARARGLIVA